MKAGDVRLVKDKLEELGHVREILRPAGDLGAEAKIPDWRTGIGPVESIIKKMTDDEYRTFAFGFLAVARTVQNRMKQELLDLGVTDV